MSDVECPYCGADQIIYKDDGVPDEGEIWSQDCGRCGKAFAYTASISISYLAHSADCLNGAQHKFKPSRTIPREFSKMVCADCGEERECTESEMAEIMEAGK